MSIVTGFLRKSVMDKLLALLGIGLAIVVGYFLLQRLGLFAESIALSSNGPATGGVDAVREVKLVTLLPKDAIPAINNPKFIPAARGQIRASEQVIGLSLNGETRAYPTSLLSSHEIVNDVVGGIPVAVTW